MGKLATLTYLQLICRCLTPNSLSMPATRTQAFTVFMSRANVKDAAAESFKSRRCETITMSHSEIAFYALLFKKMKNQQINRKQFPHL